MHRPFTAAQTWPLLKEAASEWIDDKATTLSAALAYYTVFSLAPLLILVVAVVGLFWGGQSGAVQAQLIGEIRGMVGAESAEFIRSILENAERPGSGGIFATVVGVVMLLLGATAAFAQLQMSLNTIWEVKPAPEYGLKGVIMSRVLSLGLVLTVGFLLLVSLVLSVAISALGSLMGEEGIPQPLIQIINLVISFGIITLLFAMIYRYLPDAEIAWRDTWVGAFVTALLFVVGKFCIGLYLGSSSMGSAYGAAGSLVILLVWIYYSSLILFFGAEVTQVYARRFGSGIKPAEHAVRVVEETTEIAHDGSTQRTSASSDSPLPAHATTVRPIARPQKKSLVRQLAPLAASFVAGRITKKARVKIEKRFIRR